MSRRAGRVVVWFGAERVRLSPSNARRLAAALLVAAEDLAP